MISLGGTHVPTALLSQLLACCWTQHCARAQPGPGAQMGLH